MPPRGGTRLSLNAGPAAVSRGPWAERGGTLGVQEHLQEVVGAMAAATSLQTQNLIRGTHPQAPRALRPAASSSGAAATARASAYVRLQPCQPGAHPHRHPQCFLFHLRIRPRQIHDAIGRGRAGGTYWRETHFNLYRLALQHPGSMSPRPARRDG